MLSTAGFPEEQQQSILKSGPIRCAAVEPQMKYLLISGDDKILKLWAIDDLKLINERFVTSSRIIHGLIVRLQRTSQKTNCSCFY